MSSQKIIDVLKELPLIKKKIAGKVELIQKYASYGSHVGPAFKDEGEQRQEVSQLIQSASDLVDRYSKLKLALSATNNTTIVDIDGVSHTISEWMTFRNETATLNKSIYSALTTRNAENDIRNTQVNLADGQQIGIVRCFDEKSRNLNLEFTSEIHSKIDATLERINATTDMIEV